MPKLRRVSPTGPGLHRVKVGKGFRYVDAGGRQVTDEPTLARIEALVLPPAWEDVWICPIAHGHLQATGIDAAGRRQYRYHDRWRLARDLEKHERILDFGAVLPTVREKVCADLAATDSLTRERVLACAVRLLDLGFFRIGSEEYAAKNQTFGLATMRKEHVRVKDGCVTFDYIAKSGKQRIQSLVEPEVGEVIAALKRRRGGGDELLAYRVGAQWVDVKSADINAHLRELAEGDFSAKDFRTWSATVLAAVGLAVSTEATSVTARKRAVTRVVKEVADYLGNTPAVCRSSYIDPRIIDLFDQGYTIAADLKLLGDGVGYGEPATQGAIERAVLKLLRPPARQALAG